MDESRRELAERLQDEGALEHPRMRQRQVGRVQDHVAIDDEVEVERTGSPPNVANAARRQLESSQCLVQWARRQSRP